MLKLILFDLDDTLYPRSAALMQEISKRIAQYMVERAGVPADSVESLRRQWRGTYGTALRGLMEQGYEIDVDDYFQYVHDIELDGRIVADPKLREMLLSIPLRRAVLTNSNIEHAERILRHMNILDCFEMIIDIRALGFKNKPDPLAYEIAFGLLKVQPGEVIFVEDTPINTKAAKALGVTTILIECPPSDDADYFLDGVMEVGPLVTRLMDAEEEWANDKGPIIH
jgi:putative hydrolase of the HAD superfamily